MTTVTYTEVIGNSDFYDEDIGDTIWDASTTSWDISGNVAATHWDISSQSYTESSTNTAVWTAA